MPSWEKCQESVKNGKLDYSKGNESEGGATMFCVERR